MPNGLLGTAWLVLAASSLLLAGPAAAADYTVSGESNTFLRMQKSVNDKDLYPLYEYLRLSFAADQKDGSAVSMHIGTWGRLDLVDRSTDERAKGDLQYGYVSYHGAKNNLVVNAGRQFVTEGVAAERIDGLYLRSDLAAGFAASAFAGSPVITEPNFTGGEFIYGGRVSQGKQGLYSIGLSALKSEGDNDSRDREEEGVDLWIHPVQRVDLTGRSSYNSLSSGWMEHAYALSITPIDPLNIGVEFTRVNYGDYFYHVTTSALSLTNGIITPDEELTTAGIKASYLPVANVVVAADYKRYSYDIAGDADYFGGSVSYALPELSAGLSVHRMRGGNDRLRYMEYRLYALKKIGKFDLAADLFDVSYDQSYNGISNSFALTGSAGYRFNDRLRLWADLEYAKSPDLDDELRGLLKLAYAFEMKRSKGGDKSEK